MFAGNRARSEALAPARPARPALRSANDKPLVAVVGNPNVGKTTLFNRLTGQNARVGNYPGVTVERRSGVLRSKNGGAPAVELVDVPGTYSLSARSAEEQIAINAMLGFGDNPKPVLAVVVVDAGQLIRNLYLVLQLVELEVPLVIALNMMDEVTENPPNPAAISELFGVPCIATNGRTGSGVQDLEAAIARAVAGPPRKGKVRIMYPEALRRDVDRVADALPAEWRSTVERDRALSLWALTSIDPDDELSNIDPGLRERCESVRAEAGDRDIDQEIIATRYAFLDAHAGRLYRDLEPEPPKRQLSEQFDRILLHPLLGFVIFISIMLLIFQALFAWSDPAIGAIEDLVAGLQGVTAAALPDGVLRDLLAEGIIGGVGNVIVFLPQILLLFLFIGLLEDSGYMARVAYLMDRIMKSLGLHGRAFVPMLSGFACAVPAILATRTMERQRDRLLTMMVVPLMTCSARLPVYTLIIAALFPPTAIFGWLPVQALLMVGMYLFATTITLISAAVLGRTTIVGRRVPLILELPPYRAPQLRGVLRMTLDRSMAFLREAGGIILVCTVVLWALLSFPKQAEPGAEAAVGREAVVAEEAEAKASPTNAEPAQAMSTVDALPAQGPAALARAQAEAKGGIADSYGGRLGKALEPVLAPLGFDWKIGVGIIGAFAAREVFVSTMALVYGIGEVDEEAAPLRDRMRAETRSDGTPAYTPLMGLSLLLFFALACQCMSTLAVVRRETKSWRWPAFMFAYMTSLAYVTSLLVYQGGKLLGF
jgi:ferrous iron transport protein B